ncbi:MAG: Helicase associated domain protein, partial [Clostridia bacterium]|nr:Helicase associated domain protein [Clostridia bacterium]
IVRGILKAPTYVLSVYSYSKDLKKYQNRVNRAKSKAVRDEAQKYLDALRRALDKADGLNTVFEKHIKAKDGKYIVFCSNVEHMREMVKKVPEWFGGIDTNPNIYVVYSDNAETSKEFKAFKDDNSEHLKLLFCIDMLNEGVHVEKIDGVILFRPTVSPIIYKQQIGRALSASKDKEPIIFDVVNNIENLYSIGTIEQEMQLAIGYYRFLGLDRNIVNEHFKIYDDLQNARAIFDSLNDALTASWDLMYEQAKAYYKEHGNLELERRYKTEDGYSLGNWIFTQRKVYKGEQYGTLGEDRVKKLEAIGMVWDNLRDLSWQRYYNAAKEYFEEHGNLNVIKDYVTKDGLNLGAWICRFRMYKNSGIYSASLTEERVKMLESIGMIWDKNDWFWERNYSAAREYYEENGDLNVPNGYVTKNGLKLWSWLQQLKTNRRTRRGKQLTQDQIDRFNSIGMIWDTKSDRTWEKGYAKLLDYYKQYGDINVSATYKTADGFRLGDWLSNRREKGKGLSEDKKTKLNALGMVWVKEDSWEVRYALAKEYYEKNGNLKVAIDYKPQGICLNKWVNEQKQIYNGRRKGKSLTDEQIRRLEEIGIIWGNEKDLKNEAAWYSQCGEAEKFFLSNGHLNVPESYSGTNGKKLSGWVKRQRNNRKKGTLTAKQIEMLDRIDMVWEIKDPWEIGFAHAEQYFREFGNLLVPNSYVCTDGYRLGTWISNQRNNYNNPSKYHKVSAKQAKRLESIGMKWKQDSQWEKSFGIAKNYYEQFGNLKVPRHATVDGLKLYDWIVEQRKKYRKGRLSDV